MPENETDTAVQEPNTAADDGGAASEVKPSDRSMIAKAAKDRKKEMRDAFEKVKQPDKRDRVEGRQDDAPAADENEPDGGSSESAKATEAGGTPEQQATEISKDAGSESGGAGLTADTTDNGDDDSSVEAAREFLGQVKSFSEKVGAMGDDEASSAARDQAEHALRRAQFSDEEINSLPDDILYRRAGKLHEREANRSREHEEFERLRVQLAKIQDEEPGLLGGNRKDKDEPVVDTKGGEPAPAEKKSKVREVIQEKLKGLEEDELFSEHAGMFRDLLSDIAEDLESSANANISEVKAELESERTRRKELEGAEIAKTEMNAIKDTYRADDELQRLFPKLSTNQHNLEKVHQRVLRLYGHDPESYQDDSGHVDWPELLKEAAYIVFGVPDHAARAKVEASVLQSKTVESGRPSTGRQPSRDQDSDKRPKNQRESMVMKARMLEEGKSPEEVAKAMNR